MEFLGEDEIPYPQLRNADVSDYGAVYNEILAYVDLLYREARLVHADYPNTISSTTRNHT